MIFVIFLVDQIVDLIHQGYFYIIVTVFGVEDDNQVRLKVSELLENFIFEGLDEIGYVSG